MALNKYGFYEPRLGKNADQDDLDTACPFLVPALDEDALADQFLPETPNRDHRIGKYDAVFAAHVEEANFRRDGSSGGLGSWLAVELLRKRMIDGVIHACPVSRDSAEAPFFRYGISRTVEEVSNAAHSHYHVVEISEVLTEVKRTPGRYLFTGIPCMVKAVRRAQARDPDLAQRIVFTLGLVCGHQKSVHWALSLGWGIGVVPKNIDGITFRVKSENVSAKAYYFGIRERGASEAIIADSANLTGGKFNLGAMMPDACNFCDDVVAETADLTIGDAWLPRYSFDWRGKNMVISRNSILTELVRAAADEGRVTIESMSAKEASDAQAGGFRQRREGLAYRLALRKARGQWTPQKRNLPDMNAPGPLRAKIYRMRESVAQRSQEVFRRALDENNLTIYDNEMGAAFKRLRRLEIFAASARIISVRLHALFSRRRS